MERFPSPTTFGRVLADMRACEQTTGLSVLEHGESVARHHLDLLDHLTTGAPLDGEWRLPEWVRSPLLAERQLPYMAVREYLVFHDCGKPYVVETDAEGRRHFPGHAAMSERVWTAVGGTPLSARLMGMDMDAHLLRPEGVAEFASRPEAPTLLLCALAEVHANAAMFGGLDSESFKIKHKRLATRGKQVLAALATAANTVTQA